MEILVQILSQINAVYDAEIEFREVRHSPNATNSGIWGSGMVFAEILGKTLAFLKSMERASVNLA